MQLHQQGDAPPPQLLCSGARLPPVAYACIPAPENQPYPCHVAAAARKSFVFSSRQPRAAPRSPPQNCLLQPAILPQKLAQRAAQWYFQVLPHRRFPSQPSPLRMNLYLRSRHNRKRVEVHCIATDGYNAGLLRPNHRAAPQLAATIVCLSLLIASGADDTDEERARWLQECDATHQMWGHNDPATAAHINALQLHVLIDLIGRIPHNHHAVLAFRPSPVQVVAIYAATTASPFVDYFVSDIVASTPELSNLFTESLMVMPISHFVNNQRSLAPVPVNPRHASKSGGEGGTAAAFNAFYKMDPSRATSWWRVLNAVPNSSIMFVKYLYWKTAQSTILSHAEQHNVSRSRVAFVGKLPAFDLHLQVCSACTSARTVSRVTRCCSASGTAPCSLTATSSCMFVQVFACAHAMQVQRYDGWPRRVVQRRSCSDFARRRLQQPRARLHARVPRCCFHPQQQYCFCVLSIVLVQVLRPPSPVQSQSTKT